MVMTISKAQQRIQEWAMDAGTWESQVAWETRMAENGLENVVNLNLKAEAP